MKKFILVLLTFAVHSSAYATSNCACLIKMVEVDGATYSKFKATGVIKKTPNGPTSEERYHREHGTNSSVLVRSVVMIEKSYGTDLEHIIGFESTATPLSQLLQDCRFNVKAARAAGLCSW